MAAMVVRQSPMPRGFAWLLCPPSQANDGSHPSGRALRCGWGLSRLNVIPSANESARRQFADTSLMNVQAAIRIVVLILIVASSGGGEAVAQTERRPESQAAVPIESTPADASSHHALRRLVCRFDFDDPDQTPYVLPRHFFRILTRDGGPPGFPDFGSIAMASDESFSGDSSLRFHLEGGSMAATLPAGIINVLPLCDYMLTANVRTRGLSHSRVRIVATFHDDRGKAIEASLHTSQPVSTSDQWVQVTLAMPGRFADAASLVLRLELLQPRQFVGSEVDPDRPILEDVRGAAWFDDVAIWQMPRAELRTSAPGNVLLPGDERRLELELRDFSTAPMIAELRLRDLAGTTVFERRLETQAGEDRQDIELPALSFGWYEATLTLHDGQSRIAEHVLPMAIVPDAAPGDFTGDNPFGIAIERCAPDSVALIPDLMRRCGVGAAIVPVWSSFDHSDPATGYAALRDSINRLLDDRVSVKLGLHAVPPPLQRPLAIQSGSMFELALREPDSWRRPIEQMLLGIDQTVGSWVVGPMIAPAFDHEQINFTEVAANVSTAMGRLVPQPQLHLACAIEQPRPSHAGSARSLVFVPSEMQPASILEVLEDSAAADPHEPIVLELPEPGMYQPRDRVIDVLMRGLHAWRAGARELFIRQPWQVTADGLSHIADEQQAIQKSGAAAQLVPDAVLPAWRTLADQLRGRRFLTELHLGDGIRCWVISAPGGASAQSGGMLIAWNEHATPEKAVIDIALAAGNVGVVDGFGNRRIVPRQDERHNIPLSDAPLFIDGVDLEPAIFRARLALDPAFVPSMHRVHERMILLHNPWSSPISGSIRLQAPEGWTISPGNSEFTIGPARDFKLPISIVLDRSVTSGPKTILATVAVQADRDHAFSIPIDVEVGLDDFTATTIWNAAPNLQSRELDLIITQVVTNRSTRLLTLDAYVVGEGLNLRRRTIADLAPGQTATRTFRIDGGAALLAGKQLRIGVAERQGVARLNHILDIPALHTSTIATQPSP
jgi:hypothetical protein